MIFFVFAASACLSYASASPLYTDSHTADLESRQATTCNTLGSAASATCWDQLNIPDYLATWTGTTDTCAASNSDGSQCCNNGEPWTTCFLRLAYGTPGSDCTAMNSQSCVLNKLSTTLSPKIAPTVQYVVRNIVNINGLFTGFNQALVGGNISGDDSISTKLYNVLNAFKTGADLNDGNVVKALLAGLPFWGTSSVLASGPQQINPTVNSAAGQAFAQGLQSVTTVSSMLMGAAYDIHDFSDTQSSLSSDMTSAGNLLGQALKLIMSDVPTFNAWAADGRFSGSASFSVPSPAPGITSAFATYVAGEVLYQAKFSATPISKILANQTFQQGRTCTPLGDVCKDSDNKAYYRSPATNVEYRFNEPSNWARTTGPQAVIEQQFGFEASAYGLLDYLEGSNVYMPVLFDGAYNCTLENKAGGSAVNLNADGSLDVACLSALPIYLVKDTICPGQTVLANAYCPFGYLGS